MLIFSSFFSLLGSTRIANFFSDWLHLTNRRFEEQVGGAESKLRAVCLDHIKDVPSA